MSEQASLWLEVATAAFAVLAAVLWFASTRVETPQTFTVKVLSTHIASSEIDGSEVLSDGFGTSPELEALGAALIKQSHRNSWAALAAAASALCQGGAVWAHHFSR
jgi:hypothetical protein